MLIKKAQGERDTTVIHQINQREETKSKEMEKQIKNVKDTTEIQKTKDVGKVIQKGAGKASRIKSSALIYMHSVVKRGL